MEVEKRISKLLELTAEKSDVIFIKYPPDLYYLTGFSGDNGLLVVDDGEPVFYTDGRYLLQAEEEINCCRIEEFKNFSEVLEKYLKKGKRVGVDGAGVSLYEIFLLLDEFADRIVDITSEVYRIRAVKDESEIFFIEKSIRIQEKVLKKVFEQRLWEGMSEKEVAMYIKCEMLREGSEREAFETIVAYDTNSAKPHAKPGDTQFAGDIVLVDWGAVYKGYHSDQTVTFIDENNPRLREIYHTVREARERVFEKIKPGISASKLDRIARDFIKEKGYGEFFSHALGHGVGLEIHERPVISQRSRDVIEEGMVFTVEPGIYVPGVGGVRLEDMILVTSSGYRKLTTIDK